VVVALLVGLWARSYWRYDFLADRLLGRDVQVRIRLGAVGIATEELAPNRAPSVGFQWEIRPIESLHEQVLMFDGKRVYPVEGTLGFYHATAGPFTLAWFPFWAFTAFAAFSIYMPWVRCRFTLRTLLIATTLVAVGLGLTVWLASAR